MRAAVLAVSSRARGGYCSLLLLFAQVALSGLGAADATEVSVAPWAPIEVATAACTSPAEPGCEAVGAGTARPGGTVVAITPPPYSPGTAVAPAPVCRETGMRRTQFALYGWLSGLDADLRAGPLEASVEASFSDILSNLDFAFMGYYETWRGRTGFYLDAVYVRLSDEETLPNATVDVELTQTLLEAGLVFPGGTEDRGLDGFVGARYLSLDTDLGFSPQGLSGSASESWILPVIGGRYRVTFSGKWSGTLRGDIGGAGGDSSWQALATLRYRLSGKTSVGVGYRYLHLDVEEGRFGFDGAMSGPLIGVAWDW